MRNALFLKHRPVFRSHIRIVWSSATERRNFPQGWNVKAWTQPSWPTCQRHDSSRNGGLGREGKRLTNVHKHCPRSASQSLIVLSREAVMTKDIPNESTFCDCAFAGCKGENKKGISLVKDFLDFKGSIPEQPALWSQGLIPWGQIRHIQCDYRVRAFLF